MAESIDVIVIVVGAGWSGFSRAYHLQTRCRSDSDMHTLGVSFDPWTGAKAIADDPSIRRHVAFVH